MTWQYNSGESLKNLRFCSAQCSAFHPCMFVLLRCYRWLIEFQVRNAIVKRTHREHWHWLQQRLNKTKTHRTCRKRSGKRMDCIPAGAAADSPRINQLPCCTSLTKTLICCMRCRDDKSRHFVPQTKTFSTFIGGADFQNIVQKCTIFKFIDCKRMVVGFSVFVLSLWRYWWGYK